MDWKSFWDQPHSIYVNARHLAAHYRLVADDIIALIPGAQARVLDHGCGDALDAARVAARCRTLYLLDAAPSVRAKLEERHGGDPHVQILAPEALADLPDHSLDLVVANSLLQYLSDPELDDCLLFWRRKLVPGGTLVLADVVPPEVSALTDAAALLRFAWHEGFLVAAVAGLVRTAASPYARVRRRLGLSTHRPEDVLARLGRAGFDARRLPKNLGHNSARMTFLARAT